MARQIWASGPKCVSQCMFVCLSSWAETQPDTQYSPCFISFLLLVFFPTSLWNSGVLFSPHHSFSTLTPLAAATMTHAILKHFKNTPIIVLNKAGATLQHKNAQARVLLGQGHWISFCITAFCDLDVNHKQSPACTVNWRTLKDIHAMRLCEDRGSCMVEPCVGLLVLPLLAPARFLTITARSRSMSLHQENRDLFMFFSHPGVATLFTVYPVFCFLFYAGESAGIGCWQCSHHWTSLFAWAKTKTLW